MPERRTTRWPIECGAGILRTVRWRGIRAAAECARLLPLLLLVGCAARTPADDELSGSSAQWFPEKLHTPEERRREADAKTDRVLRFLAEEHLAGLLIGTPANFAWITAGGDPGIAESAAGSSLLFVREDGGKYLVAGGAAARRLQDEDLRGLGYTLEEVPWFAADIKPDPREEAVLRLARGAPIGSDNGFPGTRPVPDRIGELRVPLTENEIARYRWLGRRTAEAVDSVCRAIRPGMTERGIEALLSRALTRHAIRPQFLQVGADERALRYGTAPASDENKVHRYVRISAWGGRWGIGVAMTRMVHFGPVSEGLRGAAAAAARVYAGLLARTQPGATSGELLQGAIADYAEAGFLNAWQADSPGGAIGYEGWDWNATPGSRHVLNENQAFAWNPSVGGVTFGDSVLLLPGDRLEVLTRTRSWPVREVGSLGRIYRIPDILIR